MPISTGMNNAGILASFVFFRTENSDSPMRLQFQNHGEKLIYGFRRNFRTEEYSACLKEGTPAKCLCATNRWRHCAKAIHPECARLLFTNGRPT
jgi:hypothetical protein